MRIVSLFRFISIWIMALSIGFFVFDHLEKEKGSFSSLQKALFFDYPQSMESLDSLIVSYDLRTLADVKNMPQLEQNRFFALESVPMWEGAVPAFMSLIRLGDPPKKAPLIEKIREGEVWRILSPAIMHKDFMHIAFNLGWFYLLGLQIERRLGSCLYGRLRFLLLIASLAIFSNIAQYLMGGSFFLGLSGVVAGLGGFIWSRQKHFPEERYPLQRQTALFMAYFIASMVVLGVVAFVLQAFFSIQVAFSIANTAHVSGALLGLMLGRLPFFSRITQQEAPQ